MTSLDLITGSFWNLIELSRPIFAFQWFEFEERGDIFVKGKDNMKVFLLTKKKESALRMF